MTPAARKREQRRREREGLVVLRDVVVHAGDTGDLLRDAGFLDARSEDDAHVLARGVEKMIAALIVTRDDLYFENLKE